MIGNVDAVYVLGNGSKYQDEEIRYSVRSLSKHVRNLRMLCIVGVMPRFFPRSVKFIPFASPYRQKDANIAGAILAACQDRGISDPFLCVHDDHFMLKDVDASAFPAWHKLPNAHWKSSDPKYDVLLQGSLAILKKAGVEKPLCFETHTPILVHKKDFMAVLRRVDIRRDNFTIKSLYANQCEKLVKVQLDDYKIKDGEIDWGRMTGRPCFSVSPVVPDEVWVMLRKLYPKPSPFERN